MKPQENLKAQSRPGEHAEKKGPKGHGKHDPGDCDTSNDPGKPPRGGGR